MRDQPARQVYLDPKKIDLERLGALIQEFGVGPRVIFSLSSQERCAVMRGVSPGVRTQMWFGGDRERIRAKLSAVGATGFRGIDQVQLHLYPTRTEDDRIRYQLDARFLRKARETARKAGVEFSVFPFDFDDTSLGALLDLGIRGFGTDYPERFAATVRRWRRP
jgi:hypothetical protein